MGNLVAGMVLSRSTIFRRAWYTGEAGVDDPRYIGDGDEGTVGCLYCTNVQLPKALLHITRAHSADTVRDPRSQSSRLCLGLDFFSSNDVSRSSTFPPARLRKT